MKPRLRTAALLWLLAGGSEPGVAADPLSYEHSSHLAPSDYLLGSKREKIDAAFDGAKPIDLGVDLGIGADCGRVDFHSTLKSTLQNMLDSKYFGDLGKDIIASSPMLLACYFSPTWCSVLKHSQLSANFLSEMRLSQCQVIDKYVDSRTEDFYRERQACAREYIQQNGGDLERAMDACQNVYSADLTSWAGGQNGKVSTNELIEASAKWAGFDSGESRPSIDLLKSMIGDTVVSKGKVSVNYGPAAHAGSPATHLLALQERYRKSLCEDLMGKVTAVPPGEGVGSVVTGSALRGLGGGPESLIDRQTVEALALMPRRERELSCRKLADAMGVTVFAKDAGRSLDILTVLAQNPNLPPNRRDEIEEKRRALKESVDLAVTLGRERDSVLSQVQTEINEIGEHQRAVKSAAALSADRASDGAESRRQALLDCSDGIMCPGR